MRLCGYKEWGGRGKEIAYRDKSRPSTQAQRSFARDLMIRLGYNPATLRGMSGNDLSKVITDLQSEARSTTRPIPRRRQAA